LHPQGTCSPLTSTFTTTNGFVFGRYKAWRRVLEAPPSQWRAILADPAFRADFRDSVRHTALFNSNVAPLASSAWSSRARPIRGFRGVDPARA